MSALLEEALLNVCKETTARGGGDTIRLQPDADGYERICLGAIDLNWEFTYKLCNYTRFGSDLPAKKLLVSALEQIDKACESRMSAGLLTSFKKKAYYAFEVEKMRQLVFYCKRLCRRWSSNTSKKNKKSNDLKKLYTQQREAAQAAREERAIVNSVLPATLVDLTSDSTPPEDKTFFPPPPEIDDDCMYIEEDHLLPDKSCLVVTSYDKMIAIDDIDSSYELVDGDDDDSDDDGNDMPAALVDLTCVDATADTTLQAPAPAALLEAEASSRMLDHKLQRKDADGKKKKGKAKATKRAGAKRGGAKKRAGAKPKAIWKTKKACGSEAAEEATPKKRKGGAASACGAEAAEAAEAGEGGLGADLTVRFEKDRVHHLYQVMNGKKALCQVTSRHCPIEQSRSCARLMSTLLTMDGYSIPQVLAVRDRLLSGTVVEINGENATLQSLHESLEAADAEADEQTKVFSDLD